jgi:hypothetical protein
MIALEISLCLLCLIRIMYIMSNAIYNAINSGQYLKSGETPRPDLPIHMSVSAESA